MIDDRQSRRFIIDFTVEFPSTFTDNQVALILRDYIHLCRFTVGLADIKIYPTNTRIVQSEISLETEIPTTKH